MIDKMPLDSHIDSISPLFLFGKLNPQPRQTEITLHMNYSQPGLLPTEQTCEIESVIHRPLGLQSLTGPLKTIPNHF